MIKASYIDAVSDEHDAKRLTIGMQLYEPKIQDMRVKKSSSYIYIIWYSLAISHQQECCFSPISAPLKMWFT